MKATASLPSGTDLVIFFGGGEERQVMNTGTVQCTMQKGHGDIPPDQDLSTGPLQDLQQILGMMNSQELRLTLLSIKVSIVQPHVHLCVFCHLSTPSDSVSCPQMQKNMALLQENVEKYFAAMCRVKERLQRQLLLRQKHKELCASLYAQVDLSMLLKRPGHTREGDLCRMWSPSAF